MAVRTALPRCEGTPSSPALASTAVTPAAIAEMTAKICQLTNPYYPTGFSPPVWRARVSAASSVLARFRPAPARFRDRRPAASSASDRPDRSSVPATRSARAAGCQGGLVTNRSASAVPARLPSEGAHWSPLRVRPQGGHQNAERSASNPFRFLETPHSPRGHVDSSRSRQPVAQSERGTSEVWTGSTGLEVAEAHVF